MYNKPKRKPDPPKHLSVQVLANGYLVTVGGGYSDSSQVSILTNMYVVENFDTNALASLVAQLTETASTEVKLGA